MRVRAYTMIGLWFAYQFLLAIVPINTGVAYWAHIGGFIAGIILAKAIRQRLRKYTAYIDLEKYR